jgi:hypothetical protein
MNKLVSDQVLEIANRLDALLAKIETVLPPPILDEGKILRLMFGGKDAGGPNNSLVMTYLRIEPLIRFCELELVPAVEEEAAKASKKEAKSPPVEKQKAVAQ